MKIIVQKFGGTSVSKEENRLHCIHHIKKSIQSGYNVAVVVSAMGRKGDPYATDTLLSLLGEENHLPKREMDLLLSTGELISASVFSNELSKAGVPNTVLTGGQAGVVTNVEHGNARIEDLQPERIINEFKLGRVVVVTGFQGKTTENEITTLGRGGSDTSATALGVALNAEFVDIFTDVNGIYTADPRMVEGALPLRAISYTETCNLAYLGAKVIHPRAVEMAMQKNIPIRVRSAFTDEHGTLIASSNELSKTKKGINDRLVTGIAHMTHLTQLKVPSTGSEQHGVFDAMAENDISVDFISINSSEVVYTVSDDDAKKAERVLKEKGFSPAVKMNCTKVSIVGAGITGVPGVVAKVVGSLCNEKIEVLQSADSHTTIWVLVDGQKTMDAIQVLHNEFFESQKQNDMLRIFLNSMGARA